MHFEYRDRQLLGNICRSLGLRGVSDCNRQHAAYTFLFGNAIYAPSLFHTRLRDQFPPMGFRWGALLMRSYCFIDWYFAMVVSLQFSEQFDF